LGLFVCLFLSLATLSLGQFSTTQYTCFEPDSDGSTTTTKFDFKRIQGNKLNSGQCEVTETVTNPHQQTHAKLSIDNCSWVPKCYPAGPSFAVIATKKYTCFKGNSKTTFDFKRIQGNQLNSDQCEVEERIKNPNQPELAKLSIRDCSWVPKCYSAGPSTDANCRTRRNNNNGQTNNDNPDPDQPCVFPFIWSGVKHNSCVNDDVAGGSWCSTKVDRNGKYIDRKWGICSPTCPVSDVYGSNCEPSGNSFKCELTRINGGSSGGGGTRNNGGNSGGNCEVECKNIGKYCTVKKGGALGSCFLPPFKPKCNGLPSGCGSCVNQCSKK